MRKEPLPGAAPAAPLAGQVAEKANEHYRTREGRQAMLSNLGAADRAERLSGEIVVRELEIQPGSTVADLGAGAGAMLPLLSQAVGPQGRVLAQDIFEDFLAHAKASHGDLPNLVWVLGDEKDTRLPENSADLVITVDAYHHYDYPAQVLASIRKALRPGGRFAIVDYFKRPGAMAPPVDAVEHVRLDRDDVIKEVTGFGFQLVRTVEHVPGKQYIAIFAPAL
jgi:ubiquinone/menaquinone biosynthesis C-methylase UbiE